MTTLLMLAALLTPSAEARDGHHSRSEAHQTHQRPDTARSSGAVRPHEVSPVRRTMSRHEMDATIALLNNTFFDSDKMKIVRHVAATEYVTIHQVRRMMRTMDFQDTKLKTARILASNVVDPHNARVLETELWSIFDKRRLRAIYRIT